MIKNTIKKVLTTVFLATIALFLAIQGPEIHHYYLRNSAGKSVMRVSATGQGGGTGFSMRGASGELYIVTNEHVCSPSKSGYVYIKADSGIRAKREIVHIDKKHDICLVKGDQRFPPLSLASKPDKGDTHYIVGHPGGRSLTVSKGEYIGNDYIELVKFEITQKNRCDGKIYNLNGLEKFLYGREFICMKGFKTYASSAIAYGGNSGSPTVNMYGNVIGILFAGSRDQNTDNHLVPLEELKRVIEQF